MKILTMHAYFSPFRGGETIAYNTFKMLQDAGHEVVYMAADRKPYFEENYEYSKYFIKDITSVKAYLKRPYAYYYNFEAKRNVNKLLDDFQPDLVHIHNVITCFSPAVLECLKNVPTIMTVHDSGIICPASTLMYKNKQMCTNIYCKKGNIINCLLNKCDSGKLEPSIRKTLRAYFITKNLKYIDKYITPSDALKKLILQADIGIKEEDITTINTFIKTEGKAPNYTNEGYFLYLGAVTKEKGLIYLLDAFKDMPENIKLHIAGKGRDEEEIKQYAKDNNITNVEFLGFISDEERDKQNKNCIATILPCNWFENCPSVPLEGYIYGKPAIASDIGGIPEHVKNNETGFLFEPGNVEQLKKCITEYVNNPQLAVKHGENAYNTAINKYSEKRYFNELIEAYNILLECKK